MVNYNTIDVLGEEARPDCGFGPRRQVKGGLR
jgi:hypothetical protein